MLVQKILFRRQMSHFFNALPDRVWNSLIIGAIFAGLSLPMSFVSWRSEPNTAQMEQASEELTNLFDVTAAYPHISKEEQDAMLRRNGMRVEGDRMIGTLSVKYGCAILGNKHPAIDLKPLDESGGDTGVICDPATNEISATIRK